MVRNHQEAQKGGTILMATDVPSWFQVPSLFVPLTRKT
jgi:hypothetical protein